MNFTKNRRLILTLITTVVVIATVVSVAVVMYPSSRDDNNDYRGGNVNGIRGGTPVQGSTIYPFYVYFLGDAACGGTLVAPDIVLTAGQCIYTLDIGSSVVVNAYSRYYTPNLITRTVAETMLHPSFDFPYYDYMLVRLDSPVFEVEPVSINVESDLPVPNDLLTVIGLGSLGEDGGLPEVLQQADIYAVPHNICQRAYAASIIDSVMICAGVPEGGKDACDGDAGSPLLDQNGNQVGIVSAGSGCGRPGYPGIYARVSGAANWIERTICDKSTVAPSSCSATVPGGNTTSTLTEVELDTFPPYTEEPRSNRQGEGDQESEVIIKNTEKDDRGNEGEMGYIDLTTKEQLAELCDEDAHPRHNDSPCAQLCAEAECCYALDPARSCSSRKIDISCKDYRICRIIFWEGKF